MLVTSAIYGSIHLFPITGTTSVPLRKNSGGTCLSGPVVNLG
ncbi:hypothetical protein THTE_0138 [Thermogutta terrifontis]|uniref:Uncharacterized protein n=1 Tax=Thermogutta terrifontis TaxID=1331910 RepID=A0A286R9W3_9BACT|nr:hypothetical protein THTE_0138 [Thermogutta terrifontis]